MKSWVGVLVLGIAGCVNAKSVVCGDKVCAPLATCDQVTATCIPAGCGDGIVNNKEQCEPGQQLDCRALGYYDVANAPCTEACEVDLTACTQRCGNSRRRPRVLRRRAARRAVACADFGYGTGRLACSSDCAPRFDGCTAIGATVEKTANASLISIGGRTDPGRFAMYAGGVGGLLLTSTGKDWAAVDSGTTANILAIWAAPETDEAFAAVAGGGHDHEVAGGWTPSQPLGTDLTIHAIWGRSADDVYAVGQIGSAPTVQGVVLHWGADHAWSTPQTIVNKALRGIAGDAAGLVAVGDGDTIMRYAGGTWTAASPISDGRRTCRRRSGRGRPRPRQHLVDGAPARQQRPTRRVSRRSAQRLLFTMVWASTTRDRLPSASATPWTVGALQSGRPRRSSSAERPPEWRGCGARSVPSGCEGVHPPATS